RPILAIASGELRFWDLRNGNPMNLLVNGPDKDVVNVAFSPNGKWIAVGFVDGKVSVWDFENTSPLYSFHQHSIWIHALCFSHDGTLLASAGGDNLVVLYDLTRNSESKLEGHTDWHIGLTFAHDDKTLVSVSWDQTIRFWSVANHQLALKLNHEG